MGNSKGMRVIDAGPRPLSIEDGVPWQDARCTDVGCNRGRIASGQPRFPARFAPACTLNSRSTAPVRTAAHAHPRRRACGRRVAYRSQRQRASRCGTGDESLFFPGNIGEKDETRWNEMGGPLRAFIRTTRLPGEFGALSFPHNTHRERGPNPEKRRRTSGVDLGR
ncbi:hypothetical protein C8R47DRAFT_1101557 [Mycena vitilis]|nr:hypothetical protein C8R47DRAFT_1101557 [Mycena vitilis]